MKTPDFFQSLNHFRGLKSIVISFLLVLSFLGSSEVVTPAQASYTRVDVFFVSVSTGNEDPDCGDMSKPCKLIQDALDKADYNDVLQIAKGTYLENIVIPKKVTLYGGYDPDTWLWDKANITIIDGSIGDPPHGGLPTILNGGWDTQLWYLHITGGKGYRAGGILTDTPLRIFHCTIYGNIITGTADEWSGGAILANADLHVEDSIIRNNSASYGAGGIRVGSGPAGDLFMSNSLVVDNYGAPAVHVNCHTVFVNNTIANNSLGTGKPGILFVTTTEELYVYNSIIYGNSGVPVWSNNPALVHIDYSLLEGGWATGTGNIDVNPQFKDPSSSNYRLKFGSPAIDAGSSAIYPPIDLDGVTRPQDGNLDGIKEVDMGAYELKIYRIFLGLIKK